jgi:streptogramin lyase
LQQVGAALLAVATSCAIGSATATPALGAPLGQITEFAGGLNSGSNPIGLATGADGNLWFSDEGSTTAIGRVTPSGTITEFSGGLNAGSDPQGMVEGPDGNPGSPTKARPRRSAASPRPARSPSSAPT